MKSNKEILKLLAKNTPFWSNLGFGYEDPKKAVRYFCTPMGALIFASLGVDGIHYCTIPSLGEYVYVVNPMPQDDRYVVPVAKNLSDFMSLIAAMQGTQLIDQLIGWDKATFEATLNEHLADNSDKRTADLDDMKKIFECTPMNAPYEYIHGICDHYDTSVIQYTSEYYETLGLKPVEGQGSDFFSVTVIRKK